MTTMTANQAAAELVKAIDEHRRKQPLGIHFDLRMDAYLEDWGMGSGDIKECAADPYEYQWRSPMNPIHDEEKPDTEAQKFGRALHKCLLEGVQWFDAHYMRGPDQTGLPSGQKGASTRKANELAASLGKEGLKANEYDKILLASKIVTSDPGLAVAFSGGMPEVSFFWMEGDVRLKMRIDYLKVRIAGSKRIAGIGDLKSVGKDWRTNDFEQACYNAIDDWGYQVQAAHYIEGMRHMRNAIAEGLYYVHSHDPARKAAADALLERLLTANVVGWQWVFFKKWGAPKVHSMVLSPGNQLLQEGREIRQRGVDNYRDWMKRKGPGELWTEPTPVREAEYERMRRR